MINTYKIGNYIHQDFFKDIITNENGTILVYCDESIFLNQSNKFDGCWYLYVYFHETDMWHPLVNYKPVNKRIVQRKFRSSDGLINSLHRYDLPLSCMPKYQGSGCEIKSDGTVYYRPQCILI